MAVNINTVYTTVLYILNKEQRGYITPAEFNSLATQVQEEIFESYFPDGNQLNRPNQKNIQTAMTALGIANANDILFNDDGSVEIEDAGFNTIYKIGSPQHKMIMQAFGMPQESTITGVSGKRTPDGYSM